MVFCGAVGAEVRYLRGGEAVVVAAAGGVGGWGLKGEECGRWGRGRGGEGAGEGGEV